MSRKTSEARAYAAACQKARRAGLHFTEDTDPEVLRIYVWRKGQGKLRLHYRGPQDVQRLPAMRDRFVCPYTGAWGTVAWVNARLGTVEITRLSGETARWSCSLDVWRTLDLSLEHGETVGYRHLLAARPPLPMPTVPVDFDLFVPDPKPVSAFRVRRES